MAKDLAAILVDPLFKGFNWNLIDIGPFVVNWSGFLGVGSEINLKILVRNHINKKS